jgi:solute carrier family 12 sodium/potassium/chloride transporter 2
MVPAADGESDENFQRFGTFNGVFVPTLLTILGVILYLRLGWVVGNVGLIGAWIIIGISFLITTATALSMSSIVSNVRIGAGGAYAIVSRSLGLEMGGSIGVPLYLALSLSVALYIFGFREGLLFIFPEVPALAVDLVTFGALFVIVFLSTTVAFRIQYLILAIIVLSLISVFAAGFTLPSEPTLVIPVRQPTFWTVFAVFFPAATGIMAGANMSGELRNPRRSIPLGTLAAIGVSFIVYTVLALWLAGSATPAELTANFTILVENAAVGQLVLAGLLAATFSSGLNSLVGASRVLQAMGEHNILPGSTWLSSRSASGTPQHAILCTGILVVGSIMLRDLNTIAPLITLFFLVTYAMINIVILVEQRLGLVSFRPMLRIPTLIPLLGTFGCVLAMFIIHPVFSLVALIMVVVFYYLLMYRHLESTLPYGDVRSSLFVAIAEWAAKKSKLLPHSQERAWRPHLLIPVEDPVEVKGIAGFIRDLVYPTGSVSLLGVNTAPLSPRSETGLRILFQDFQHDGIYANWTIIKAAGFANGTVASMQALRKAFFSPNVIFIRFPEDEPRRKEVGAIIAEAKENRMGSIIYASHPKAELGRRRRINLWLTERCAHWSPGIPFLDCDLAMLLTHQLRKNWNANLTVIVPGAKDGTGEDLRTMLGAFFEEARIPVDEVIVVQSTFDDYLADAPLADLSVLSLGNTVDFSGLAKIVETTGSSCLFCRDSSEENVLA